jgi:hypothetical protein
MFSRIRDTARVLAIVIHIPRCPTTPGDLRSHGTRYSTSKRELRAIWVWLMIGPIRNIRIRNLSEMEGKLSALKRLGATDIGCGIRRLVLIYTHAFSCAVSFVRQAPGPCKPTVCVVPLISHSSEGPSLIGWGNLAIRQQRSQRLLIGRCYPSMHVGRISILG